MYIAGDHIRVARLYGLYYHHMLVMEVIDDTRAKVIHYSGDLAGADVAAAARFFGSASGCGSGPIARVQQEVKTFSPDELSTLEVLSYPDSVPLSEDPVGRALSREHETDYGIFTNNCESFANWSSIGHNVTTQGVRAQNSVVGAAAGGLTGGTVGAVAGHLLVQHLEKDDMDEDTKHNIKVGAAIGGAFLGALLGWAAGDAHTDSKYADE